MISYLLVYLSYFWIAIRPQNKKYYIKNFQFLEGLGAFFKLHYMRKHPILSLGPLKRLFLLRKIQKQGQFAGNFLFFSSITLTVITKLGFSETIREVFLLKDK